jgi:hypothetical protein
MKVERKKKKNKKGMFLHKPACWGLLGDGVCICGAPCEQFLIYHNWQSNPPILILQ